MTSPIQESLSKLDINSMGTKTRSQTAREQQQAQAQAEQQAQQPAAGSSRNPTASPLPEGQIRGPSGFKYDISGLNQAAQNRVREAFESGDPISVEYCEQPQDDYYVFQIKETFPIFVGDEHSDYKVPHCWCGMKEEGLACRHIFWLEDQLVQAVPEDATRPSVYRLEDNGSTIHGMRPFDLIEHFELKDIAEDRGWLCTQQGLEEGEDRENELNNILSVLEPGGATPSELHKQFVDLVSAYAMQNDGLYARLRDLISPEVRASVAELFFTKLRDRVQEAFKVFDESEPPLSVVECANKLQELVEEIEAGYTKRIKPGPGFREVAQLAVSVRLDVLEGVVQRKEDLYERLINDPTKDKLFALNYLTDKGRDVVGVHQDRLSRIADKIRSHGAPERYINKLNDIMPPHGQKRGAASPGGSSSKKPMK